MANDSYKLTYNKNKTRGIHVDKEFSDSFFKDNYEQAFKTLESILESQSTKINDTILGVNNRILFTGQRGCGKTSAMYSFAKFLENEGREYKVKVPKDPPENGEKTETKKSYFYCLPMVDPSHFDDNNNILLSVITSMFAQSKRLMQKSDNDSSSWEELLKQFDNIFKSLGSIKTEISSWTIETLNRKSGTEDMGGKMEQLVHLYLNLVNDKLDKNVDKLVLMIDDIDMSVSYAAVMLEQIRKYLELDNLIILMSANLDQLYNEMREHYSRAFRNTLTDKNQALSIDVEDLASKYLLKLFPTSYRINLEQPVSQLLRTKLEIDGDNDENQNDKHNIQQKLLRLIWRKTRLLFIPSDPENTLHPIVPTNLRELVQFLDILVPLEDVSSNTKFFDDGTAFENCEKNLQVFKEYFLHTWIPNHLPVEEEKVFANIPSDITEINKHLINSINTIGTEHKKRLMSREVSLDMIERNADGVNIDRDIYTMVSPNDPRFVKANKISDIFNQPSNYSYGDLLLMIDKYETYFESENDRRFSNAIRIYYSILLFETMFFKSEVYYKKNEFDGKREQGDIITPIEKLIGGTVYYPNYFEIITDKNFNQKGPSFDAKRAFYHKIEVEDDAVVKCPLFTVLYYGDIRPDRYDTKHIYDTTYNDDSDVDGKNYVTFDILSLLSNILNPWHTIERSETKASAPHKYLFYNYSERKFERWRKINSVEIGGTKKALPNSILPFYSVDIMLKYLKKSYQTSDLGNIETKNVSNIVEYKKAFFESGKEIDYVGNEIRCNIDNIVLNLEGEHNEIIEENINILSILKLNKSILKLNNEQKKDSNQQTILSFVEYLNRTISTLLEHYKGSQKDLDSLVKELHKFSTPSEIYKCLVDVLWYNALMENVVRKKIQDAIHSTSSVKKYYGKLKDETQKLLKELGIGDSENIYEIIYKEAEKVFF